MNAIGRIPVDTASRGVARYAIRAVLFDGVWPNLDVRVATDAARKRGVGQQRALAKLQRVLGPAWSRCSPRQDAPRGSLAWRRLSGTMAGSVRLAGGFDPAMTDDPTIEVAEFIAHPGGAEFWPYHVLVSAHALGRCVQRGGARSVDDLHAAVFALHDALMSLPLEEVSQMGAARAAIGDDEEARVCLPGPAGGVWSCALLALQADSGAENHRHLTLAARTYFDRDMLRNDQVAACGLEVA